MSNPKAWIAAAAALGLVVDGLRGLVIGAAGEIGPHVGCRIGSESCSGGSVPRRVRRDLATIVLADDPEAMRMAFCNISGEALFKGLEREAEQIIRTAISIALCDEAVVAENAARAALRKRFLEETDPDRRRMPRVLGERLLHDRYRKPVG